MIQIVTLLQSDEGSQPKLLPMSGPYPSKLFQSTWLSSDWSLSVIKPDANLLHMWSMTVLKMLCHVLKCTHCNLYCFWFPSSNLELSTNSDGLEVILLLLHSVIKHFAFHGIKGLIRCYFSEYFQSKSLHQAPLLFKSMRLVVTCVIGYLDKTV